MSADIILSSASKYLICCKRAGKSETIIQTWPSQRLWNPIVLSSLLTGLVDGKYFKEGIELYDWCLQHTSASPTQTILRSAVTISSLIECYKQTGQPEKAIELYLKTEKEGIVMTQDVYFTIARLCDTGKMWREKYREMVKERALQDPVKF